VFTFEKLIVKFYVLLAINDSIEGKKESTVKFLNQKKSSKAEKKRIHGKFYINSKKNKKTTYVFLMPLIPRLRVAQLGWSQRLGQGKVRKWPKH